MSFWSALGAGISGLLGMGSSAMNAASQNQANKYNLQAQRETNQANMAINQSQLDYAQKMYQDQVAQQWKMFNTTNAYNSPAAQKQRYLDAGLNPYIMMGSQPAASASSMPTAGVPNQLPMQAARMEAFNQWNLGRGLSDAGIFANIDATMANAAKTKEETEGVALQNEYFRRNQEADLAIKVLTASGLDEDKKYKILKNNLFADTYEAQKLKARLEPHAMQYTMNHLQSQIDLNQTMNQIQQLNLDTGRQMQPLQIERMAREIDEICSRRDLNYARKKEAVAHALVLGRTLNNMPNYTKEQVNKIASSIVSEHVVMPEEWNQSFRGINDVLDAAGKVADIFSIGRFFRPKGKKSSPVEGIPAPAWYQ
jgi:murein DD-endopeptidase MepM/ murein hydrolase activator NlpD